MGEYNVSHSSPDTKKGGKKGKRKIFTDEILKVNLYILLMAYDISMNLENQVFYA